MKLKRRVHPDDDTLSAFADSDEPLDSSLEDHVAGCTLCSERVADFRATRRLLKEVGAGELRPEHDIAYRVVTRLRLRQTAIGNMNEVIAAMRMLFRGLADLFGGNHPPDGPSARRDEETPHG